MKIKTLIIADIHNKWEKADKIIKHETPDKIVFLGDYFDDFGDDYRVATETADWLGASLEQPNRVHLMGNHDTNYAFKQRSYKCSGYEAGKDYAINSVLTENDWRKLPLHTWVGSWLCSHAGVHNQYYTKYGNGVDFKTWLTKTCDEALDAAFQNKPALPILRAGSSRGGSEIHGGINWCDADEFVPVAGINQIFGHTPQPKPRWINAGSPLSKEYSRNLCLDTYGHSNYYAVHDSDTDAISIHYVGDM